MDYGSPFALAKEIAASVARLMAGIDIESLQPQAREAVTQLKNQAADIRLDMRDYGLADNRAEQERIAKELAERLAKLQASILRASEYNILGAADVAQLSANVQQLISVL